jgi:protein ImuB
VPLITAIQQGNQRLIAAVDKAARRLKLRPGMTIAHAQSLMPNLNIHDAMPAEDEAALSRLALWCTRYSPLVTPTRRMASSSISQAQPISSKPKPRCCRT